MPAIRRQIAALLHHEAVAFAGAIGQPDAHAGEVPCAFVELVDNFRNAISKKPTFETTSL